MATTNVEKVKMNVSRYQCEATLFKQIVQLLIPVKQECNIIVSREQREKEIGEELESDYQRSGARKFIKIQKMGSATKMGET